MDERKRKIIVGRSFCEYLEEHDIHYDYCIKHKEVLGCDESANYYDRYKYFIGDAYCICKNLFLKERKGEKRTFLVIVPMEKQVDLKELKERLGTSKLEFASSEKMQDLLQTTPGNVSIFNLIFDQDKKVNVVLDQDLFDSELLAFHPLYNGMSIFLKEKEIRKFLDFCNRDYLVGEIPERETLHEKTNVLTA